jgi:hypothetical protein
MTTTTTAPTTTKKHPIRGFLYGIPFGLGLAMIAIGQKWAALGTWPPFLIFVIGVLASMAWGMFGPAKAPKGDAPMSATTAPPVDQAPEPDPEPEPAPGPESGPDPEPGDGLTKRDDMG